jgi:hypothetical protein
MVDYDRIQNCNGLKYSPSKTFDNFWLIIFYVDQNIRWKKIALKSKPLFVLCGTPQKIFTPSKIT